MGQLVYYFVTMVDIVVLVSLQIPTFTCDLGYINNVVVHNHTKPKTSICTGYDLHYSNLAPVI